MERMEERRRQRASQLRGEYSYEEEDYGEVAMLSSLARARRSMEWEHSHMLRRSSPKRNARAISARQRSLGLARAKATIGKRKPPKGAV